MVNIRKKFTIEELDKRLQILKLSKHSNLINKLRSVSSVVHTFRNWTPLKLVALSYLVGQYLRIIGGLEEKYGFVETIYIDLFAGNGVNRIEGSDSFIAGSPLVAVDCAITSKKKKFDKMYFVDEREENTNALRQRLNLLEEIKEFKWIHNKYEIISKDANEALEEIIETLNKLKYVNYLAFLDPYK